MQVLPVVLLRVATDFAAIQNSSWMLRVLWVPQTSECCPLLRLSGLCSVPAAALPQLLLQSALPLLLVNMTFVCP
jgi:hypothetical protein